MLRFLVRTFAEFESGLRFYSLTFFLKFVIWG